MACNCLDFPTNVLEEFYESHALFQNGTTRGYACLRVAAETSPMGSVFRHSEDERAVGELQDSGATTRPLCSLNLDQPLLAFLLLETDSLR